MSILKQHLDPMIGWLTQTQQHLDTSWTISQEVVPVIKSMPVLRVVGFGAENAWPANTATGISWNDIGKRKDFTGYVVIYGASAPNMIGVVPATNDVGSCSFDSGGPAVTIGDNPTLVATESIGVKPCHGGLTFKVVTFNHKEWIERSISSLGSSQLALQETTKSLTLSEDAIQFWQKSRNKIDN